MSLIDRVRKLKKKAGELLPDDTDDALDRARDLVPDPGDVLRAAGRAIYETDTFGPRSSLKDIRADYNRVNREVSDPLREVATIAVEEDLDPLATARQTYRTARGEGLGEAFRARPNTLGKRVAEGILDPLNLIPFGGSLSAARAAGQPITRALIRTSLRELAAPAAGQVAGHEIGQAVGGERGAQIGELAGLLGGAFGPNLVRRAESATDAGRASERVPGTAIVPVDVARGLSGEARVPDDAEFQHALSMTPGGMLWSRDGVIATVDRFQQTGIGNQPTLRGGVYYAPNRSAYKGAIGDFEGGPEQVSGKTIFRRPLVVRGQYVTSGIREVLGDAARQVEDEAAHVARIAGSDPPNVFDPDRAEALRRSGTERALRGFLDRWIEAGDRDDAFAALYPHLLRAKDRPSGTSLSMAAAYPLIERVMADAARRQEFDSIMAMARQEVRMPSGKISEQPYIEEIMDLREARYPTPEGGFTLRPEFEPLSGTPGGLLPATREVDAPLSRAPFVSRQTDVLPRLPDGSIDWAALRAEARQIDQAAAARARSPRDILQLNRAGLAADVPAAGLGAAANVGREVVFEDERDPRKLAEAALFGAAVGATGAHLRRVQTDVLPVQARGIDEDALFPGAAAKRREQERIRQMANPQRIAGQIGDEAYLRANPGAAPLGQTPPPPRQPPPVAPGPVPDAIPPKPSEQTSRSILQSALNLSREINLGGDIGQWFRAFTLGGSQAVGQNPVDALVKAKLPAALAKGLYAMGRDSYAQSYRRTDAFRRFGAAMDPARVAEGGGSITEGVIAGFAGRHRILGAPLSPFLWADKAVFDRFVPVFGAEVSKIIADGLPKRVTRGMAPADVDQWVGTRMRNLLIGPTASENATSVVGNAINKVADGFPFISPRRVRGEVRNVSQLGNFNTPEGHMARRFWVGAAFSAIAGSVGFTALLTGKSPVELLDPTSEDSLVNPSDWSRFLGVELPNGTVIGPFQSLKPVAKVILKPIADATGEGYQDYQTRQQLLSAAGVFLDEWLKSLGRETLNYGANRLALPARVASEAVLFNEDYWGRPIRTADSAIGQIGQVAEHALRSQVPIFAQSFTEREQPMVPGTEPTTRQRLTDTVLNWTLNLSPRRPPNLPKAVDAELRAEVMRHGGDPGGDPLGAYFGLNLPQDERATFEAEHPAVREFLRQRTLVQEPTVERPQGRDATNAYKWVREAAESERDSRMRALADENLPGDEYRRRRSDIMADYRGDLRGAQLAIFGTNDRDAVDAILSQGYKRTEKDELDRVFDAYYAIQPVNDSAEARDAFFAERKAFLDDLSPDMRQKFETTLDSRAAQISDTERRYVQTQRLMSAYYEIPKYRSFIPVEDTRAVDAALGRARDLQTYTGMPLKRAIIMDETTDKRIKMLALRVVGAGAKAYSPERRRFLRDNPQISSFFSSLSSEMAAQLIAPGAA